MSWLQGTVRTVLSTRAYVSQVQPKASTLMNSSTASRAPLNTMVTSEMRPSPANPTYKDALAYLNSLQTNHAILEERRKNPPKDLKQIEALKEMFQWTADAGYTPSDFDPFHAIHVAGTKGKGTTCAFVNSILSQYRKEYHIPNKIGLYTSPHLLGVCERIRINSKPISEEKFAKYFFEVWDKLERGARKRGADPRVKPSYFRYLTLLSLHTFVREQVDIAIYEVGVGGEFDSTNVLARPAATGISSLGVDHVQVLGNTVEEIAWHKAGIMKSGSPSYTVRQPPGAMQVLKHRAQEKNVTLKEVSLGDCLRGVPITPDEDFQKRNASLAVVLAARALTSLGLASREEKLRKLSEDVSGSQNIIALDNDLPDLFKAGLATTLWRGRGETVVREYGTWMLDGAHTKESLAIVSDWYGRTVKRAKADGKDPLCILVFNQQTETRNAMELIDTVQRKLSFDWELKPQVAIFCSNVTYKNQQYKLDFVDANLDPAVVGSLAVQHIYAKRWAEVDSNASTHVMPSIEDAVELVRQTSEDRPGRPTYILCTGSFRLVGGALSLLEGSKIATESSTASERRPTISEAKL